MKTRRLLWLIIAGTVAIALVVVGLRTSGGSTNSPTAIPQLGVAGLPQGVTLRQIDGGPHYYADISPDSAWMDQHILVGAWDEQPLTATEVHYDVAMGNNIYWNLAGDPLDTKDCGGAQPCRVDFSVIRAAGMHASAPDVTSTSGSETVAYEGSDESDLSFGAGSNGWNPKGSVHNTTECVPSGSQCGYTVAKFFYTGQPATYGSPGYPTGKKPITQGYGKTVLFWLSAAQAGKFLAYSDTLSADSYWMSDPSLSYPSQGGCALLPTESKECDNGNGSGLTLAERSLPANYAYNVTELERIEAANGPSKPVAVDVETGCPEETNSCTNPAAAVAAAWQALIAGARGIIWFQHNFGGKCIDFRTFYDGSNPASSMYNCQPTPGVTLHSMVQSISAFNYEVASLNSVLLSPFANNYVSTANADVSTMAKYYNGTFYVFAASGRPTQPPSENMTVTFRLAIHYTGNITVVDEHRILHAVNGVFTDKFADQDSVHIYKVGSLQRQVTGENPSGTVRPASILTRRCRRQ